MNKYVQALVAAAALTIIALGGWFATSSWQANRQLTERDEARALLELQALAQMAEEMKLRKAAEEAEADEAAKVAKGIMRSECKSALESLNQFGFEVRVLSPDGMRFLNADQCRTLIAEQ